MTSERWQRIEQIYHAARDREPAARQSFLDEACGEDADLRAEIGKLLEDDESSPWLLDRPAWEAFDPQSITDSRPTPGMRLGPYEIESPLGAGGMGDVYRGRDTRLNRSVAIKFPRARFNDRLAREAKAISAMNHPHICTLYDVGPNFLVMELLEGETLSARLAHGPLAFDTVCRYGAQIASALAAAHAKGIVHRDLKPGNIMLTRSGVKVLDFGLARATGDRTVTQTNAILGTPAYMAPEQRQGKQCTPAADIYALGLILQEMAKGQTGRDYPAPPPFLFVETVNRCLHEDAAERWQSARDVSYVLESLDGSSRAPAAVRPLHAPNGRWIAFAVALALLLAILPLLRNWRRAAPPQVVRLAIAIPEEGLVSDPGQLSGAPAISPDGKVVVLSLGSRGGNVLWTRRLDSDRFERLEGTEGAAIQPFWSPDGAWIGFFAGGKLKKMKMPHGVPQSLCDLPTDQARGGAWSSQGTILFGVNYKGLMRIPDSGGEPVLLAGLDAGIGENSLRFPQFFADGDRFIYFSRTLDPTKNAIYLDALKTVGKVQRKRLVSSEGPSALGRDPLTGRDFLLFPKERRLWAQQVDESSGAVRGEPLAVSGDVGQFSTSATGALVFRRASSERNSLSWIDRGGKQQGSVGQPGDYWDVALSPDDRHAAALNHHSADGRFWVDIIDLIRNSQTPFSDPTARTAGLAWSRDGARLYFTSWNEKQGQVLVRALDSAAAAQPVLAAADRYDIRSVAPDGKTMAADGRKPGNYEGMAFAFNGQPPWKQPFLFPAGVLASMAQFSPDGRWVAYESTESGAADIYVSEFPGLASRRRISTDGGAEPRWAPDGKALFYVTPDNVLLMVPVQDASHMTFGSPERLFHLPGRVSTGAGLSYDVARDGRRFLTVNTNPPAAARDLGVIFNWPQLMDSDARH